MHMGGDMELLRNKGYRLIGKVYSLILLASKHSSNEVRSLKWANAHCKVFITIPPYTYLYLYMQVQMYVCISVHVHMHTCLSIYIYMHTYMQMWICTSNRKGASRWHSRMYITDGFVGCLFMKKSVRNLIRFL